MKALRLVRAFRWRLVAAACMASAGVAVSAAGRPSAPNLLFIVADDLGYGDCGVHGCADIPTPHLDALAADGVRFTDAYVTSPVCSPARAALLTGCHQLRVGVPSWLPPGSADGLDLCVPTLADYLKKVGYRTALIGKWHLGEQPQYHPLNRGFDEFFGFLGGGRSYWPSTPLEKQWGTSDYLQLLRGREPAQETEYLTGAFAREAVDFIERNASAKQPFLLVLAFNAVHDPMEAPDEKQQIFAPVADPLRRTYAGMLSAMDDGIGRVLAVLRDTGLEENTLVCFLSDNGGPVSGLSRNGSGNGPLRGGKAETWEGGIRVPLFMKWSGTLPAGAVFNHPVTQMDLTATALAAAGLIADTGWPMDGVNLLPFLTGDRQGEAPHQILCWEYLSQWAVRDGYWKLTFALPDPDAEEPLLGLFDLRSDLSETNDLSAVYPEKVRQLKSLQEAWKERLSAEEAIR